MRSARAPVHEDIRLDDQSAHAARQRRAPWPRDPLSSRDQIRTLTSSGDEESSRFRGSLARRGCPRFPVVGTKRGMLWLPGSASERDVPLALSPLGRAGALPTHHSLRATAPQPPHLSPGRFVVFNFPFSRLFSTHTQKWHSYLKEEISELRLVGVRDGFIIRYWRSTPVTTGNVLKSNSRCLAHLSLHLKPQDVCQFLYTNDDPEK